MRKFAVTVNGVVYDVVVEEVTAGAPVITAAPAAPVAPAPVAAAPVAPTPAPAPAPAAEPAPAPAAPAATGTAGKTAITDPEGRREIIC